MTYILMLLLVSVVSFVAGMFVQAKNQVIKWR